MNRLATDDKLKDSLEWGNNDQVSAHSNKPIITILQSDFLMETIQIDATSTRTDKLAAKDDEVLQRQKQQLSRNHVR